MNANLLKYVTGLADDSMVLSQRLSQWCSHGPTLEEDIALTNIALDYLGRARMFYQYAAELEGLGRSEDDFAMWRSEREYSNLLINELPNGDFAFTLVRQWLLDEFYQLYLSSLLLSTDKTLTSIAAKALKETGYHLIRSRQWVDVLANGTDESHQRINDALGEIIGYIPELFTNTDAEKALPNIAVNRAELEPLWQQQIAQFCEQIDLVFPEVQWQVTGGREGIHSEHLGYLLTEMQCLARSYPTAKW